MRVYRRCMTGELSDADMLLVAQGAPIAVRVGADECVDLVRVTPKVIDEVFGGRPVDSLTGSQGRIAFWFSPDAAGMKVNQMAILWLITAAGVPARSLPLLRGLVLITGIDASGKPSGLSDEQLEELSSDVSWFQRWVLRWRVMGDADKRRARRR